MSDFLKMDIFFAVTTGVVFLGGLLLLAGLFYLIRILRNVEHVSHNISEESDNLKSDLGVLRKKVREEGMKFSHFLQFFTGIMGRRKRNVKKTD